MNNDTVVNCLVLTFQRPQGERIVQERLPAAEGERTQRTPDLRRSVANLVHLTFDLTFYV